MSDRQNVADFRTIMQRAYTEQKNKGVMQASEMQKLDKLFALGLNQRCVTRDGRVLFFWRTFRRRVANQYAKQHGRPLRLQLNWSAIWAWIVENWQLIIRTIFFLVPFII